MGWDLYFNFWIALYLVSEFDNFLCEFFRKISKDLANTYAKLDKLTVCK